MASRWKLWQRPTCDLCHRKAVWEHPDGGLRCDRCPRPTDEEACRNYDPWCRDTDQEGVLVNRTDCMVCGMPPEAHVRLSASGQLMKLLAEADVRVSFSKWCRSGIVGDKCICWRCRGLDGPTGDEWKAQQAARKIDEERRRGGI